MERNHSIHTDSEHLPYRDFILRFREAVCRAVPPDATVAVVNKGDPELLRLDGRKAWDFPQDENGTYLGHYPGDDTEAIGQVEASRAKGAEFLVLPATAFWWLEHYPGLRRHLENRCRVVAFHPNICSILSLRGLRPPPVFNTALIPRPKILCVLGMHRSGTSLLMRLTNFLGVSLGPEEHLMRPTRFNPTGFWEQQAIVDLNNELLSVMGGNWRKPPPLPSGWERTPGLDCLRERARALIEKDFAGLALWGWKDPRNCLTLPFWRELLPSMRFVLCIRNPVDVARSLEHSVQFETGVTLWLHYTKSSLGYTGNDRCLLVFYEELVDDCATQLRRLAAFLDLGQVAEQPDVQVKMREFVNDKLHHHRTSLAETLRDARLSFPAKALYLVLRAHGGVSPDAGSKQILDSFSQEAFKAHAELQKAERIK